MIQPNVDITALASQSAASRMENLTSSLNGRASEKEIDKVAGEFQTMCYAHLVKSMFATTEDSAIWGEGHAAGLLRSIFIEAMANAGGAESLNIKASIKKSMYQSMGVDTDSSTGSPRCARDDEPDNSSLRAPQERGNPDVINPQEAINVLL